MTRHSVRLSMTLTSRPLPTTFIKVRGPLSSIYLAPDLIDIGTRRVIDHRDMIVAMVITLPGTFIHVMRNITLRIGDMRLDISAIFTKVRNHFPTILGAAVIKSCIPLPPAMGPMSIRGLGKIPAKRLSNLFRCSVMGRLGGNNVAQQGEADRQ